MPRSSANRRAAADAAVAVSLPASRRSAPPALVRAEPVRGTLEPRDDRGRKIPFELRVIEPEEVGAVYDLHVAIGSALEDKQLLQMFDRAVFEEKARDGGRIIGAFTPEGVVGYGILSFPGLGPDNMGRVLGLPEDELDLVASLESSGVAPRFQGNGLQGRMITYRMETAAALGHRHRLGYASPRNAVSLVNVLGCGLRIRRLMERWPGMLRYICHNDAEASPVLDPTSVTLCSAADRAPQEALLRAGYWGFDIVRDPDGAKIKYGRFV